MQKTLEYYLRLIPLSKEVSLNNYIRTIVHSRCGVILDGWMFPLKEEDLVIERPLIFINTLTFHIDSNLKVMEKYASGSNEIFTIRLVILF